MHAVSSRASWQEFRLIRQHYLFTPESSLGSLQSSSEKLVDTQTIFVAYFFIDCDSYFLLFDGSIVYAVIMRSSFEKIYNHMHIYAKERLSLIKSVHISFCTEAFMGFRTS